MAHSSFDCLLVRESVRDLVRILDRSLVAEIESNDSPEVDFQQEILPTAPRTSEEPALHSIFFFSSLRMMPNKYIKTQSDNLLM